MQQRRASKPSFTSKLQCLLISMTSLFIFALLFPLIFSSLFSPAHHGTAFPLPLFSKSGSASSTPASIPPEIKQACKATRFPDTCESTLTLSNLVPPNPYPTQIMQSAMWLSSHSLNNALSMARSILDSSADNPNRYNAASNCLEMLHSSDYRIHSTTEALPRGRIKDARAWMSGALFHQYDCWSALRYVNSTQAVHETMSFLDSLIKMTSNALSMITSYDIFGNETGSWRQPMTERAGFWESGSEGSDGLSYKGGLPSGLTADVTVCKGEEKKCDHKTVQEAVDAAPDNLIADKRFVIRIQEGVYEETVRVPLEKKNLAFLGDGMGKTVITGSLNGGQPGITTYNTATVGVLGDGFIASDLTIQNTAGPNAHQAVAFRSDSDLSIIVNCEFLSNQDTLYAHGLRQFYKSCRIEGNVDFIFGNSASFFQDCIILVRPRQLKPEKGENNAVTAHGRTDPAQSTGFVFHNCLVNGTEDYMVLYRRKPQAHRNFLGRPWKEYSRTVFIQCTLEAIIKPLGWLPWRGEFALKTLFYGEFDNSGPGANLSGRVPWSNQILAEHVYMYSVQNFIQGDEWIPTS
ncbi:Pectinesterase [Bertholletia excelsa]